jgi:hypothetical protein
MHSNAKQAKISFTMETLARTAATVIRPGMFMVTIDLKSAYWMVPLAPSAAAENCFEFKDSVYAALILLFGHRQGPFVFTKLIRPILALFRALLLAVIAFIDDFACGDDDEESALRASEFILAVLKLLGWVISEKSQLFPSQVVTFLGLIIDSKEMVFRIPEEKLARVDKMVAALLARRRKSAALPVQDLHSLEGYVGSTASLSGGNVERSCLSPRSCKSNVALRLCRSLR